MADPKPPNDKLLRSHHLSGIETARPHRGSSAVSSAAHELQRMLAARQEMAMRSINPYEHIAGSAQ